MTSPDEHSMSNSLMTHHSTYPTDVVDQDMLHQSVRTPAFTAITTTYVTNMTFNAMHSPIGGGAVETWLAMHTV